MNRCDQCKGIIETPYDRACLVGRVDRACPEDLSTECHLVVLIECYRPTRLDLKVKDHHLKVKDHHLKVKDHHHQVTWDLIL